MKPGPEVIIHRTGATGVVMKELRTALQRKTLPASFLYQTSEQARLWVALQGEFSPAANDPKCRQIYTTLYAEAWGEVGTNIFVLIGLGCADGQKEIAFIKEGRAGQVVEFLAVDGSKSLAQAACQNSEVAACSPVVMNLAARNGMAIFLARHIRQAHRRVITLFGVLPNLEPNSLLSNVASLLRPDDLLLLSANLIPGDDLRVGMEVILAQYDNEPTRSWLRQALVELGCDSSQAELKFTIVADDNQFCIAADFIFNNQMELEVGKGSVRFYSGDRLRAFQSYRHTSTMIEQLLVQHNLEALAAHITVSGEEGVWLARRRTV